MTAFPTCAAPGSVSMKTSDVVSALDQERWQRNTIDWRSSVAFKMVIGYLMTYWLNIRDLNVMNRFLLSQLAAYHAPGGTSHCKLPFRKQQLPKKKMSFNDLRTVKTSETWSNWLFKRKYRLLAWIMHRHLLKNINSHFWTTWYKILLTRFTLSFSGSSGPFR